MSQNEAASIHYPKDAFQVCPSCNSKEPLRQWSFNVYCAECGWDSGQCFVEAGGLDDLIYAYECRLEQEARDAAARRLARNLRPISLTSICVKGDEVAHA